VNRPLLLYCDELSL